MKINTKSHYCLIKLVRSAVEKEEQSIAKFIFSTLIYLHPLKKDQVQLVDALMAPDWVVNNRGVVEFSPINSYCGRHRAQMFRFVLEHAKCFSIPMTRDILKKRMTYLDKKFKFK